jgi:lipopolysaccharide/colanic/teichoic acid biosynthesis glycosyltransferase
MAKRLFDLMCAFLGLLVLSPLILIIAICVLCSGRGPIVFAHERMGRDFKPFKLLKFRTMVDGASGPSITIRGDKRVTAVGRVLRRSKLDELPQLINVLKGDMSLVGPRPEVREYVERFRNDYKTILTLRPGVTDEASIVFRHEDAILASGDKPEEKYLSEVLPRKIELAKRYVTNRTFFGDIRIIFRTLGRL